MDKETKKPVTERVRNFEDACRELGERHPYVSQYREICGSNPDAKDMGDLVAYMKLRIVATALNEGWKPNYSENERRWYPWFNLYTKEEVSKMTEAERYGKKVLVYHGECSMVGVSCSYSGSSDAPYSVPCQAYRTEELAIYAGQQFISIYAEFLFGALIQKGRP